MKFVFPWPDKGLSPNARMHHHPLAALKKRARKAVADLAYEQMPYGVEEVRGAFAGDGPIAYQVTFYPPDKRHRDDDNIIASWKAGRDGLADALGVNDRRFRPHYIFADPAKPGRVEVKLLALSTEGQPLLAACDMVEQKQAERCPTTARPTPETLIRSETDGA